MYRSLSKREMLRFLFHFYDLQKKAGIQRAICELSNALVADGNEVFIVSATARSRVAYALDDRVSLIEVDHPEPGSTGMRAWMWKTAWALRQWLYVFKIARRLRPTIFVDHGTSLGLLYPFRTIAGAPFALQRHFPVNAFPNGRVIHKGLSYLKSSSVIVVLVESIASELRSCGYKNVYVIPNALPMSAQPSEYVPQDPKIGLLMGRAKNPQKGFDIFLEALALRKIPGWKFMIVGPEVDQDPLLRGLVEEHGLQETVDLLPATDNPLECIRKASCVIMPSRYEALPMVALESLAIGRPLIASNTDGLKDVVVDGVNGRLFPCGDIRKLSECLVNTCQDEEKLVAYARNAPGSLEKFRPGRVVEAWKAIALECNR